MTTRTAWLLPRSGSGGQTREDTRLAPIGTMTPAGVLTTRSGVVVGGGYQVTGSGMTATVPTGRCVVQGTTTQGPIPVVTTSAETVAIPDGTGQPRIDLIGIKVYENVVDASGETIARPIRVAGTPGPSPSAPTPPAAFLTLAEVRVEATSSAGSPINWGTALTDRRTYTAAAGGIHTGGDNAPGAYPGQYRDNVGVIERWDGSTWVPWPSALRGIAPGSLASGSFTGQWRDGTVGLQRWSGSAWAPAAGEFQTHVPAWTATDASPSVADGFLSSRWSRVGRQITWIGTLSAGPSTNGGDGHWRMSLPVAAANLGIVTVGTCNYFQQGFQDWPGICQISSGASVATFTVKTASGSGSFDEVSNTVPVAAGATTNLRWAITYEAAS
ncbi:hypothetical protein ACFC26_16240 [Kitasatospora purpeofusca]|uniref:hypothetical protein n=1 Tax=Kitasatospora purpeofusca TaxID=67352 RepID=UPI0035DF7BAD